MKRFLLPIIAAIIVLLYIVFSVNQIVQNEREKQQLKVESDKLNSQIDELEEMHSNINTKLKKSDKDNKALEKEKKRLEKTKRELESKLQAKKESQVSLAKATGDVVNFVTGSKTASASSSPGGIKGIITAAANKHGISVDRAMRIAECESTYKPTNVNNNYWVDKIGKEYGTSGGKYYPSGLFQHVTLYWPARAAKYGYSGASVFDPVANANVTMAMWADGQQGLWECN